MYFSARVQITLLIRKYYWKQRCCFPNSYRLRSSPFHSDPCAISEYSDHSAALPSNVWHCLQLSNQQGLVTLGMLWVKILGVSVFTLE